jgi:hypothetical protein
MQNGVSHLLTPREGGPNVDAYAPALPDAMPLRNRCSQLDSASPRKPRCRGWGWLTVGACPGSSFIGLLANLIAMDEYITGTPQCQPPVSTVDLVPPAAARRLSSVDDPSADRYTARLLL